MDFWTGSSPAARSVVEDAVAAAPVDPDKVIRVARFFSYPKQVLYFVASFIALISLFHFASLAFTYATRKRALKPFSPRSSVSVLRLPKAVSELFRIVAFRCVVPVGSSYTLNVAEVFLAAAYMATLFTWTLVNTTTTTGSKVEPHYYANRAGTIAASHLPIMTALGMKNNILSWLTGISFDKLNYLHRVSARVICVLIWIHAGGRMTVGLVADEAIVNRWVQCGLLAAITLTLLSLVTLRPIRERSYESFKIIHTIFALMFLLAVLFHLTGRTLTFYGAWPALVVWGIDRLLRLIRIIAYNLGYFLPTERGTQSLDAQVDVLSPHFLRVTLSRPSYFHWRPGQSAYLTLPTVSSSPFEAHPFTISTIDDGSSSEKNLVFFVRVRNGFTRRLLAAAETDKTFKVFLDGPYSSPPLLLGYSTVVLLAGGSGVAFTLPLFLDVIRKARDNNPVCQKVVFIWAIREAGHVQWISDLLTAALSNPPEGLSIEVKIFVTSMIEDAQAWEDDSTDNEESKPPSDNTDPKLLESPFVQVQQGRPDIKALIETEVISSTGAISVNVCGTRTLAEAVREQLRSTRFSDILRGGPTISLHVEAFGNA
ncbi:ferric reductase NAD binding domain-containing protein [Cyathus striatus]|nr:ferric reductase NAD binding domain-containing protein [Cyathus striatus]